MHLLSFIASCIALSIIMLYMGLGQTRDELRVPMEILSNGHRGDWCRFVKKRDDETDEV